MLVLLIISIYSVPNIVEIGQHVDTAVKWTGDCFLLTRCIKLNSYLNNIFFEGKLLSWCRGLICERNENLSKATRAGQKWRSECKMGLRQKGRSGSEGRVEREIQNSQERWAGLSVTLMLWSKSELFEGVDLWAKILGWKGHPPAAIIGQKTRVCFIWDVGVPKLFDWLL